MATDNPSDPGHEENPENLAASRHHTHEDTAKHGKRCCRPDGPIEVTLAARAPRDTEHGELNSLIRLQVEATSFSVYQAFMDKLVQPPSSEATLPGGAAQNFDPVGYGRLAAARAHGALQGNLFKIHGTIPYELLRLATEAFLLSRCGPACRDSESNPFKDEIDLKAFGAEDAARFGTSTDVLKERLTNYLKTYLSSANAAATPYLQLIVDQLLPTLPNDRLSKLYRSRWECPSMIELIWSYWHEEGAQCQAMNAIALRFQNRRSRPGRDPLAALEIDPLRPLASLLWGWVEASYKRLTVERRAYEYDHHYGLTLVGAAVPPLLSADSRSKFLEAFHSLLHIAHLYYVEKSDTTRIPDGFALLNALRHVHLVLAEGAHNQYGDLPWTARVEMLIEQWLLARPEMREFLRGRVMVPYQEGWMGQVDTMKKLQSWSDVTVTHYHELARCGEALLLAVRHGPWASTNDQEEAKTWADYWRPELQRYIYAYKAVTGADLTNEPVNAVLPARLLQARLARQHAAQGALRGGA